MDSDDPRIIVVGFISVEKHFIGIQLGDNRLLGICLQIGPFCVFSQSAAKARMALNGAADSSFKRLSADVSFRAVNV